MGGLAGEYDATRHALVCCSWDQELWFPVAMPLRLHYTPYIFKTDTAVWQELREGVHYVPLSIFIRTCSSFRWRLVTS